MSEQELARLDEPRIEAHSGLAPRRLIVRDVKKGWGRPAAEADKVTINFVGAPYRSGAVRWRSRGRLEPFTFHLGGYDILPGLETGLRGMKVGGRRELIIPPRLGTGKGTRAYTVDLIAVYHGPPPRGFGAADGPQDPGRPKIEPPSGPPPKRVIVKELRPGSGPRVEIPSHVVVKSYGVRYEDGVAFLNAWGPDKPTKLALEDPHSIWAAGLEGMRVGGRRKLIVPSQLAYGGGALLYVVELLSIE